MAYLHTLSLFFIGFSVIVAPIMIVAISRNRVDHVGRDHLLWGGLFLASLAVLQILNYGMTQNRLGNGFDYLYKVALFLVAPAFYLYVKPLLVPEKLSDKQQYLHFLPILLGVLPTSWAVPMAFLVGAGYVIAIARLVYLLRSERAYFGSELVGLAFLFVLAIAVTLYALNLSGVTNEEFYVLYAIAIGSAMFVFCMAIVMRPSLANDVAERAQVAYAVSTLSNVDVKALHGRLNALVVEEQIHLDPRFNLKSLAEELGITSHQASELLNTQVGKGFSRWVRELRIEAARTMLVDEPSASVLSVALSVGFSTQSNFYTAFKEIAGTTPAQYRSQHLTS